jgi:RhoGAP domain
MDPEHFDLLKYIIAVAAYVESEKESNKMTAEALAIVLAPTCTGLDGMINRLPATASRMSASLGRTSIGRPTSSNNVLQLSVVKDLEQWTSLFEFMINYHEELLHNWTGEDESEEQVSLKVPFNANTVIIFFTDPSRLRRKTLNPFRIAPQKVN